MQLVVVEGIEPRGVARVVHAAHAHAPWERTLCALFAPEPPSRNDLRAPVPLRSSSLFGGTLDADDIRALVS